MLELTDKNFKTEVLDSKKLALVDFWAPWCGPCKTMMPIMEALTEEHKDKDIIFAKMNVDDNSAIPSQFAVMSIPTFILFKDGKPIEQFIGIQNKNNLKKKISVFL